MRLSAKECQSGFSLVELMISMTLGLLILTALVEVFVNNSRARDEIERANQQTENGRYAIQLLADDLRNAGYLAEFNPQPLGTPNPIPNPCAFDIPTLNQALPLAVQGYDLGAGALPCLPADLKPFTDILVVRRASTCAVGDVDCDPLIVGAPYFQASGCSVQLGATTVGSYYVLDSNPAALLVSTIKDCVTAAPLHQYRTHIYFIALNDQPGDRIPTLKRAELGVAGFNIVSLVQGIEDLQIEYGIDTTTSGAPSVFTADPNSYNACTAATTPTCTSYWRNTVSAKLHVLARNITQSSGYVSKNTYAVGLNANGTPRTAGPFNDQYRRHVYQSVVRLNNTAGRNSG